MSLYKDSTLAMIPTAYKDGKLYSVRPTDGSGDFTFSRGTTATRVASSGYIEKGRENLSLYSNTFSSWNAVSGGSVTSGQSGYDGTSDAWLLTSGAATYSRIERTISHTGLYTISVYAKAGTLGWLSFENSGISSDESYFDLTTGTLGSLGTNVITANIESVGSGWYRCSATLSGTSATQRIYPAVGNGDLNSAQGNIYIQDFQFEQGLVATDYIETTTTSVSAGILEDMPRLDYSGGASCPALLLEPQRSNELAHSEYILIQYKSTGATIEYNQALSPEGLNNACRLNGQNGWIFDRYQAFNGSALTMSIFAKAGTCDKFRLFHDGASITSQYVDFNLTTGVVIGSSGNLLTGSGIEDYENGWYRCHISMSASATSGAFERIQLLATGDMYVYGWQQEYGSYPTSYIPTYGSSVTRSADNAVATHTIADTETLTYFSEFIAPAQQSGGGEHLLENSSGSSRIRVYQNNSTTIRVRTDVPSANFDYTYSSLGISVGDVVKICLRVENGVMTAFINGVEKNTFAAATINFGKLHLRPQSIMSVDSTIIFPTALTDSECIALTTL